MNVPVPVYGGVPPAAATVMVELPPLHRMAVAFAEALSAAGSVIVTVAVPEHPFASVTVKEYVPAVLV